LPCQESRGKKINNEIWLGRVIDKEKLIFYNNKEIFHFFKFKWQNKNLKDNELSFYEDLKNTDNGIKTVLNRSFIY
jgi:hypothetical protein